MLEIIKYSREQYLESVQKIEDFDTLKFSKYAMEWWDDYYSWTKDPPWCLQKDGEDLCYLFFNISKDKEYLTIHNIFTPKKHRFNGYAFTLLKQLFIELCKTDIKRFKMYSVSTSLEFYLKLGVKFWGVNNIGQYYCDMTMPKANIGELKDIAYSEKIENINEKEFNKIYEKLKLNGNEFDEKQKDIHQKSLKLIGDRYCFSDVVNRNAKIL